MMRELVLATHNEGKRREIEALLAPLGFAVKSAGALGLPEPEENGASFAENAEIKALAAARASGLTSLSDDSGLVIPALGGDPGIYSARWTGPEKDFSLAFARIQKELAAAGAKAESPAYFICVLCLAEPSGATQLFEGRIHGTLTFPPRGEKGFGYDPVFIPEGGTKSFAEISVEEKHAISHRARAFAKLVEWLGKAEAA